MKLTTAPTITLPRANAATFTCLVATLSTSSPIKMPAAMAKISYISYSFGLRAKVPIPSLHRSLGCVATYPARIISLPFLLRNTSYYCTQYQHYTLWRWIDMRDTVFCSALSATDNKPTKERGRCVERPLFWVVLLHSASSLAQQQLCGEYLVVGLPLHDRLEVAQCCSHERGYLIGEFLNGRTGEFVGRRNKLRDTLIGLFGVKLFFLVEGLLTEHLVICFSLTGPGVFSVGVGHAPPFLGASLSPSRSGAGL